MLSQLCELYVKLGVGVLLGWLIGCYVDKRLPNQLGKFLFSYGVPLGIVAFIRRADLSGKIWLAPIFALLRDRDRGNFCRSMDSHF